MSVQPKKPTTGAEQRLPRQRSGQTVPTENVVSTNKYWRVEVKSSFDYAGEHFEPRTVYHVPDNVYSGKLDDKRTFKDLCSSAQEEDSY